MDVTAALDNVYDNFKAYADTPDSEADIVIGAYDGREKKFHLIMEKDSST